MPILWLWVYYGKVCFRPNPGETRPLVILGVFFAVQIILLNYSVQWTLAAFAAVLLNVAPVFINLISHFVVPGDRLSNHRFMGLLLSFIGAAIVLLGQPDNSQAPRPFVGNILSVVTAIVIAARMVYTQQLVQRINSPKTIFWQVTFSLPVFLVCAALAEPMMVGPLTLGPILAWLYCSFFVVGIAFILWVRLLEAHAPGLLAVFVFPTPIFGVLFSALFFGEKPPSELVLGVLSVAFGVLLVTLERRNKSSVAMQPDGEQLRQAA